MREDEKQGCEYNPLLNSTRSSLSFRTSTDIGLHAVPDTITFKKWKKQAGAITPTARDVESERQKLHSPFQQQLGGSTLPSNGWTNDLSSSSSSTSLLSLPTSSFAPNRPSSTSSNSPRQLPPSRQLLRQRLMLTNPSAQSLYLLLIQPDTPLFRCSVSFISEDSVVDMKDEINGLPTCSTLYRIEARSSLHFSVIFDPAHAALYETNTNKKSINHYDHLYVITRSIILSIPLFAAAETDSVKIDDCRSRHVQQPNRPNDLFWTELDSPPPSSPDLSNRRVQQSNVFDSTGTSLVDILTITQNDQDESRTEFSEESFLLTTQQSNIEQLDQSEIDPLSQKSSPVSYICPSDQLLSREMMTDKEIDSSCTIRPITPMMFGRLNYTDRINPSIRPPTPAQRQLTAILSPTFVKLAENAIDSLIELEEDIDIGRFNLQSRTEEIILVEEMSERHSSDPSEEDDDLFSSINEQPSSLMKEIVMEDEEKDLYEMILTARNKFKSNDPTTEQKSLPPQKNVIRSSISHITPSSLFSYHPTSSLSSDSSRSISSADISRPSTRHSIASSTDRSCQSISNINSAQLSSRTPSPHTPDINQLKKIYLEEEEERREDTELEIEEEEYEVDKQSSEDDDDYYMTERGKSNSNNKRMSDTSNYRQPNITRLSLSSRFPNIFNPHYDQKINSFKQ